MIEMRLAAECLRFSPRTVQPRSAGYTGLHEIPGRRGHCRGLFIMSDYEIKKTDAEWREQLDPMQFQVARHAATERPFTGKYWDHWEAGKYNCVGCGTPLFESDTKFDAGCGWPSYWQPVNSEVIERVVDRSHGMVRVEVRCNKCGSHLGHVFEDGPAPTGERFCINSAAIDFAPK
jgi:peptide-methionine (R)-S-oxide reductase